MFPEACSILCSFTCWNENHSSVDTAAWHSSLTYFLFSSCFVRYVYRKNSWTLIRTFPATFFRDRSMDYTFNRDCPAGDTTAARVTWNGINLDKVMQAEPGKEAEAGKAGKAASQPSQTSSAESFLANSRSLANKVDEFSLWIALHNLSGCVIVITGTWLNSFIPDATIKLAGCNTEQTGWRTPVKTKEYIYINSWSMAMYIVDKHCCLGLKFLIV